MQRDISSGNQITIELQKGTIEAKKETGTSKAPKEQPIAIRSGGKKIQIAPRSSPVKIVKSDRGELLGQTKDSESTPLQAVQKEQIDQPRLTLKDIKTIRRELKPIKLMALPTPKVTSISIPEKNETPVVEKIEKPKPIKMASYGNPRLLLNHNVFLNTSRDSDVLKIPFQVIEPQSSKWRGALLASLGGNSLSLNSQAEVKASFLKSAKVESRST